MNFKIFLILYSKKWWIWMGGIILFLFSFAQNSEQSVLIRRIEGLSDKQVAQLVVSPLVMQYEDVPYTGPDIDPDGSYSKNFYNKDMIISNKAILKKRVELAISYKEKGDIEQFSSILVDVITRYNFNQEAAWAALLLGEFEFILHNLEEARKYLIYAANVHINSSFGLQAAYKLAITLERMGNWEKSEELLNYIINLTGIDTLIKEEAKIYLRNSYIQKARWYYESQDDEKAKEFYLKYLSLTDT